MTIPETPDTGQVEVGSEPTYQTSGDSGYPPPARVSVVIPNFNYGRFVCDAVRSALDLDWPDVEVIVVDDGSTDDSLEKLDAYRDRITLLTQDNAGPREACNRGFACSTGDALIFLDSDDQLEPLLMREVAKVWRPGVSKVQVLMERVSATGERTGRLLPQITRAPTPEEIRKWITITSSYPTPPGSGNIYRRDFLELLFPLDDRCGDATDSACLAAAPILGDVVTVLIPLVLYRVHSMNRSKLLDEPARFHRQIKRAEQRQSLVFDLTGRVANKSDDVHRTLRRSRHLLQLRVAESRLSGGIHTLPGDSPWRIARDVGTSIAGPGHEKLHERIGIALWCFLLLLSPRAVAHRLIFWRFS